MRMHSEEYDADEIFLKNKSEGNNNIGAMEQDRFVYKVYGPGLWNRIFLFLEKSVAAIIVVANWGNVYIKIKKNFIE